MIEDWLARLERWLAANRPDYYAALQPGTTDDALAAFEARFALTLPQAFRELYQWRNGQPQDNWESFQGTRMFCSLEDIADTKDMLDGMIGKDFDTPEWWRASWVPFLSNGGGDYLCVDLGAEDGGTTGQLRAFVHDDGDERSVEHASIEAWLADLVRSMESGTLELC